MDYELVSFRICPYVQRARITLLHKRVPHTVTYVDLKAPPPWFTAISPLGQVPLLRVDGTVLFESTAICEFIDETTPPPLHPADPLARARNRAWIAFAAELQGALYQLATAASEELFVTARTRLLERLERLEAELGAGPYFNGPAFSLVDATYAPLWQRLALLDQAHPLYPPTTFPRLAAWSAALLALPEVRDSVVADFPARYRDHVAASGGYAAALFTPRPADRRAS